MADAPIALKFLLPDAANTDAVGRFLRETRAAVRLRSEHVAKVLDVGTLEAGSPYIVVERLEGRDLQTVLGEKGRLSARVAAAYVLEACEAIAEAHARSIVHGDLKPANLFLTRRHDGTPCIEVLDFGVTKLAAGGLGSGMTKTSTLMGTPYYISPEQLRSSKLADCRSDIWALGMILYELLTGTVAFPRDTLPELCTAIIYDEPPNFGAHGVDVPPSLAAVVMRCLAKAPELRYQTLAELASALAQFVVGGDACAERISRILDGFGVRKGAPPDDDLLRIVQSAVPPRPRWQLWVAGALGAALAVASVSWLVNAAGSTPPAAPPTPTVAPVPQVAIAVEPVPAVALGEALPIPSVTLEAAISPRPMTRATGPEARPASRKPAAPAQDTDDFGARK